MQPRFFAAPDEFRAWLEANHDSESEVVVGFHNPAAAWECEVIG